MKFLFIDIFFGRHCVTEYINRIIFSGEASLPPQQEDHLNIPPEVVRDLEQPEQPTLVTAAADIQDPAVENQPEARPSWGQPVLPIELHRVSSSPSPVYKLRTSYQLVVDTEIQISRDKMRLNQTSTSDILRTLVQVF